MHSWRAQFADFGFVVPTEHELEIEQMDDLYIEMKNAAQLDNRNMFRIYELGGIVARWGFKIGINVQLAACDGLGPLELTPIDMQIANQPVHYLFIYNNKNIHWDGMKPRTSMEDSESASKILSAATATIPDSSN